MLPPVQRSFSEHGIEDATGRSCASSRLGSNLGNGIVSNCLDQECLRNRKISSSEQEKVLRKLMRVGSIYLAIPTLLEVDIQCCSSRDPSRLQVRPRNAFGISRRKFHHQGSDDK
jgi:hypothetical protein